MSAFSPALLEQLRAELAAAPVSELPAFGGEMEALRLELQLRIATEAAPRGRGNGAEPEEDAEEVLDVAGAAALLHQTERWVRKHAGQLPQVPMPGSRLLRFSRRRLLSAVKRWGYSKTVEAPPAAVRR